MPTKEQIKAINQTTKEQIDLTQQIVNLMEEGAALTAAQNGIDIIIEGLSLLRSDHAPIDPEIIPALCILFGDIRAFNIANYEETDGKDLIIISAEAYNILIPTLIAQAQELCDEMESEEEIATFNTQLAIIVEGLGRIQATGTIENDILTAFQNLVVDIRNYNEANYPATGGEALIPMDGIDAILVAETHDSTDTDSDHGATSSGHDTGSTGSAGSSANSTLPNCGAGGLPPVGYDRHHTNYTEFAGTGHGHHMDDLHLAGATASSTH